MINTAKKIIVEATQIRLDTPPIPSLRTIGASTLNGSYVPRSVTLPNFFSWVVFLMR